MPLDNKDLQSIGELIDKKVTKIVTTVVNDRIGHSEEKLTKAVDNKISQSESRMTKVIDERASQSESRMTKVLDERVSQSEQRIIKTISREINDLAEINRAFIDKFDNHEHRIKKLEIKASIA